MDVRRISAENPKAEQWRLLSQYAYPTNIRRYLEGQGHDGVDSKVLDFIAGCIQQGEAYFAAAERSPLDIAPLLLYYGATNLLAGTASMLTAVQPTISDHGMKLHPAMPIADVGVAPGNPTTGALQQFSNTFSGGCALTNGGRWTVGEIFGSIPDLKLEYANQYPNVSPYTIPVEIVRQRRGPLERVLPDAIARFNKPEDAFDRVVDFSKAYLRPQISSQWKYIVLHRKLMAAEIGTYSISGQKHLQVAHAKQGQLLNPSQLILMFMGLFALGYLSRYHPEMWNPFVRSDVTGERLVVEKFLAVCSRYLPNLVLNAIYGSRIQFVNEPEGMLDLASSLTEDDMKGILLDMQRRGEFR